ncbi:MAG: HEAT repeat domain-containing protein [Acidobacteriota bacterium]
MLDRSHIHLATLFATVLVFTQGTEASFQKTRQVSVEALIYDLKHPDGDRRKEAARILGEHRIRKAVPALIELTHDPDHQIRRQAVGALVRINDPRALPAYIRLTQDFHRSIQEKSIEGIVTLYVVEEGGFVQGVRKVVDFVNPLSDDYNPLMVEPYVAVDPTAVDALAKLLGDPRSRTRKQAATALGILRAYSALDAIQSRLAQEEKDGVKVELIRAIYKIGDPGAGKAVLPLTRDSDKKVHDEAIYTLGRLRVTEAVPTLSELYGAGIEERRKVFGLIPVSGSDDLQKRLFEALAHIGDPASKSLFFNALADGREFNRRYAAEGLGRVGDSDVLDQVARAYVREKSRSAKLAMSFALYRLGRQEHLEELVRSAGGDQGHGYLLEFSPAETEKLYPYLRSEKNSTRVRLLDVIGLRGGASAIPVVEELTASKSAEVVSAANLAIRRLQGRHRQRESTQ